MKHNLIALLFASCSFIDTAHAFAGVPKQQDAIALKSLYPLPVVSSSTGLVSTQLKMAGMVSDFGSAMPEKPTLTVKEQMQESATAFISNLEGRLKEGVAAPPEVEALREARDSDAGTDVLAARIYELLIEQGMLYDQDPEDGRLSLTNFDIKNNLDIPEVKDEFAYLYKYGMSLCAKGILDVETVKSIVLKRLIERTGLTPEEFDSWLGY